MPIFQKSVIQKYLKGLNTVWLNTAYDKFNEIFNPEKIETIKNLKEEEYQDGFLRDLFVEVLGYTLKPDKNFDLVREFKNQTNSKKADGAILKNEKAVAVIELKSTKTKDLTNITEQAFNYKHNQPGCKYVITSNFQKLRLYVDYSNEYEEFDLFNLQKSDFELLYLILRQKSIFTDTPQKLKDETRFHEEKISKQLYEDYSNFKNKIFENLVLNNPKIKKLILFKKTQKLLDRLLFIFFAEDCGLLPPNSIVRIIEKYEKLEELDAYKPLYDIYKQYFSFMNKGRKGKTSADDIPAYNGGLFASDKLLDSFKIDDKILKTDCLKMSAYDFSTEVDVNILGQIFEHSLNEIEEMEQKLSEKDSFSKQKTSKRKKDGVFYTPKYITGYIVENTIGIFCVEKRKKMNIYEIEFDDTYRTKKGLNKKGKQLYEKLNNYKKWLKSLKILDPACGSGAFLNQALQFLITEHKLIDDLIADLTKQKIRLFDIDKNILENNLFGVDINEESVEIAKLSLWLRTAQKGRKLSTLNDNIKCGNSLIDDPEVAGDKAFDWNIEFQEIMENGGFDVVIGNPPWVSLKGKHGQKINKNILEWLINKFQGNTYLPNLFEYFIKLGLILVKKGGYFSFIVPDRFGINAIFKNLRKEILTNYSLNSIIYKWNFPGIVTDTMTFTIENKKKNSPIYIKKTPINKEVKFEQDEILNNENFIFKSYHSPIEKKLITKLLQNKIELINIADTTSGFGGKSKLFTNKKTNNNQIEIIKGQSINRYVKLDTLFFNFIKQNITGRTTDIQKLGYKEKILVRKTGNRILATYDNTQMFPEQSLYFVFKLQNDFLYKYILTILNSKLISWLYINNFVTNLDSTPQLKKIDFDNFPIVKISIENQQKFVEKADLMLDLNQKLYSKSEKFIKRIKSNTEIEKLSNKLKTFYNFDFKTFIKELKKKKIKLTFKQQDDWEEYFDSYKTEINDLQIQISQTDNEIDQMIYELYELTDEEIGIIENKLN